MDYVIAFLIGGAICVIGQLLIDYTKITPARILVTFVVLGVALEAFKLYQPLVDLAGCGATVPLTGFGYNLARGTRNAVEQSGWLGIFTGPMSAGSAGISAALFSGLVVALVTKSKSK